MSTTNRSQDISALARQLWQDAGQPAGRDLEFWLKAESQVQSFVSKLESQKDSGDTAASTIPSRTRSRRERPGHASRRALTKR